MLAGYFLIFSKPFSAEIRNQSRSNDEPKLTWTSFADFTAEGRRVVNELAIKSRDLRAQLVSMQGPVETKFVNLFTER